MSLADTAGLISFGGIVPNLEGKQRGSMFRVTAETLEAYLAFDPKRKDDLEKLNTLMRKAAPGLRRYLHKGTPVGSAGMRMKMIGYGRFRYAIKSGKNDSVAGDRRSPPKELHQRLCSDHEGWVAYRAIVRIHTWSAQNRAKQLQFREI
jgi:hypothetical protein